MVKHLGTNVDETAASTSAKPDHVASEHIHDALPAQRSAPRRTQSLESPSEKKSSLDSNLGRLVIEEGRSRYVNNTFWANLSTEVEDLKSILDHSESEDEHYEVVPDELPSQKATHAHHNPDLPTHHGFMFGFRSHAGSLAHLHPPPDLLLRLWTVYEERCDPLIKMLHIPTMRKTIYSVKDDPAACPRAKEPLLFAIYFATMTALTCEECKEITGESRPDLVARYRFGTEQALARAHFLTSEEMSVLQALVLFLVCLRRHEDSRVIWSLCGLVVRIATTLGLHRDGEHFDGLCPFDVEIRRRTWWQIAILDMRTSEDHGSSPTIVEHTFDTKYPLNVNDEDLTPDMQELPHERQGVTEMTFCLIRIRVCNTFRRLSYDPPKTSTCFDVFTSVTLQDREKWVEECHRDLEDKYLRYCRMDEPIEWVICTVSRLIMAKMWLVIYHSLQRRDDGALLNPETRDRLFITSLESIEYALLLETEVRTVKWGWLFRTYCQWHALAFLLSELCIRTRGVTVMRAWRAVDNTVVQWGGQVSSGHKSYLWRPLRKLLAKAREARERELASDRLLSALPLININDGSGNTSGSQSQPPTEPTSTTSEANYGNNLAFNWTTAGEDSMRSQPQDPSASLLGPGASFAGFPSGANNLNLPQKGDQGSEIPTSPFFANHPPAEYPFPQSSANPNPLADWFMGTSTGGNNFFNDPMALDDLLQADVSPSDMQAPSQTQAPSNTGKPDIRWDDWDEMVHRFERETGMAMNNSANGSSSSTDDFGATNNQSLFNPAGNASGRRPMMGETWF